MCIMCLIAYTRSTRSTRRHWGYWTTGTEWGDRSTWDPRTSWFDWSNWTGEHRFQWTERTTWRYWTGWRRRTNRYPSSSTKALYKAHSRIETFNVLSEVSRIKTGRLDRLHLIFTHRLVFGLIDLTLVLQWVF